MRQIEHRIADQHHQFFVLAPELAAQWLLIDLFDHAFADPLPELFLRGPKFVVVEAKRSRSRRDDGKPLSSFLKQKSVQPKPAKNRTQLLDAALALQANLQRFGGLSE